MMDLTDWGYDPYHKLSCEDLLCRVEMHRFFDHLERRLNTPVPHALIRVMKKMVDFGDSMSGIPQCLRGDYARPTPEDG